ncbi:MAG: hypothetical protein E6I27_12925 [Chloroflexi bacterium]|nr:MAG: hypothetical protein E6I27_12925 [Chloroflexota bacterium]
MSVRAGKAVGQISADGQFRWDGTQWVPIPPAYREPTSWSRPMQLITAGLFLISAITSVVVAFVFINHDSMLKAIQASGPPSGTDVETAANFGIAVAYGVVIFFAILQVVAAIGSYLGWRWMFWGALVLFGLNSIGAFTNLGPISNPKTSAIPFSGLLISELFALLSLAMFVWMLIAAVRFGPWAMKKPGR